VSNCAKTLESAGLLSRTDGYSLVDPETVLLLLVRYADSFGEEAAEFAERAPSLVKYTGE
jgi:hypothetical protein